MKCETVQSLLVSYLNNETTPSERTLIQAHISTCAACQKELALMFEMQGQISSALQRRAAQAFPSQNAWERLDARLTKAAQPSPANLREWLSHLAPGAGRISTKLFLGGVSMRRNLVLMGLAAILVIAIVVIFNTKMATPVSAKEILDHAYAVQTADTPTQGIEHFRSVIYTNLQALAEGQCLETTVESYHDLQSGNVRLVTIDNSTGKVLDAFAYDGTYTYSVGGQDTTQPVEYENGLLIVYRSPQENAQMDKSTGDGDRSNEEEFSDQQENTQVDENTGAGDGSNEEEFFDQMRNDPNVQLAGQETWDDGRKVYVLQSQQQIKVVVEGEMQTPFGLVSMYFDTTTYEMLGNRVTMEKDGQEILVSSQKILANEILPAGSSVAWDLSDLQGIQIVDDPNREFGDLLPEVISVQELAARTQSAYLLKDIPAGFLLEVTVPPKQPANEPFIYIGSYRSEANDTFVIQAAGPVETEYLLKEVDESYTTASGLTLHFMGTRSGAEFNGKLTTAAIVEAPGGLSFMLNSTLTRDLIKSWAEELVQVK